MANCNNHPSHLLPGAFHGSHSPSSGTGRSQDLSCTRFPCSLPELHISFVFDTLRFSVCIHIRVRLLYQSTSRLLHILSCSLPQNPWSPTVSFVLSGSIVVPPSLLYLIH